MTSSFIVQFSAGDEWLQLCSLFQYANDLRYEQECGVGVATHDHCSRGAIAATQLSTISHLAETCSVIGIDEGQFVSCLIICYNRTLLCLVILYLNLFLFFCLFFFLFCFFLFFFIVFWHHWILWNDGQFWKNCSGGSLRRNISTIW